MGIRKESFGKTKDGKEVFLYTLVNARNSTIKITNFGGIVTHLLVPDKVGKVDDIVLGFDSLEPVLATLHIRANINPKYVFLLLLNYHSS